MARRKKKFNFPTQHIKTVLIIIVLVAMFVGLCFGIAHVFSNSKMFQVESVSVDSSLSFIRKRDYSRFIGENIFQIDIKKHNKRLSYKYPQIDGLKIIRQFPNRILLVAKQRMPFAQIPSESKIFTIDDIGVLLSTTSKISSKLSSIEGVKLSGTNMILGKKIVDRKVKAALLILNAFKDAKTLSSYKVSTLNMETLSKIQFTLSNDLVIIMGPDEIGYKISILNSLISQHKFSPKDTKYIDMRFKDPVIGRK